MAWSKEQKAAYAREYRARRKATQTPEELEAQRAYFRTRSRERYRRLVRENPDQTRAEARLNRRKCVGIVEATAELPRGPCQICGRECEKLNCDHDHATGRKRGWLCTNCNLGLGLFKDNPQLMASAIQYLQRFNDGSSVLP